MRSVVVYMLRYNLRVSSFVEAHNKSSINLHIIYVLWLSISNNYFVHVLVFVLTAVVHYAIWR